MMPTLRKNARRAASAQRNVAVPAEILESRTLLSGSTVLVDQAWIQQNLSDGALFFDQANTTYRFQTDFHAAGTAVFATASGITIDLNGHDITFGSNNRDGTAGISPFRARSSWSVGSDDVNYSRTATGSWNNLGDLKIQNGRIRWAGTTGKWATAIGSGYVPSNITIQNMYLEGGGEHGTLVSLSDNVTIHSTYLLNHSKAGVTPGKASIVVRDGLTAYNNVILGGNAAIHAGSRASIYDNVLRHHSTAGDGYAITLAYDGDSMVKHNLIVPTSGRGILLHSGKNHTITENLIVVHEASVTGGNLAGIQSRGTTSGSVITDNQVLAVGSGSGERVSGVFLGNSSTGEPNRVTGNTVHTLLTSLPMSMNSFASALTLEKQGADTVDGKSRDVIEGNRFYSNNSLIRFSGPTGGAYQGRIAENSLNWTNGFESNQWVASVFQEALYATSYPASSYVNSTMRQEIRKEVLGEVYSLVAQVPDNQNRKSFFTGYWRDYDSKATLIDVTTGAGVGITAADTASPTPYPVEVDLRVGHSLYVIAQDAAGQRIANQTITVQDSTGTTFSGKTDANGLARLELIDYALERSLSSSVAAVQQVARTNHKATISGFGTVSLPLNVSRNSSDPLVLKFGELVAVPQPPTNSTIVVDQQWIQSNLSDGALFFDQANATYRFEADFHAAGTAVFVLADNITVDLNGHTITFGSNNNDGTAGIHPYRAQSTTTLGSDAVNYTRTSTPNWSYSSGLIVENGRIVWTGTTGTWASAIGGRYTPENIIIRNMYLESGGPDGTAVDLAKNVTVHDSHLVNHSHSTSDRHQGPATIITKDNLTAYNNIIEGGNSAINTGSNAKIYNNVLRHSGADTNGYGVFLYRNQNAMITNNLIVPTNGRGILYNAGTGHQASGNLIVVHERPNAEFGTALNPPGFRSRYEAVGTSFENNRVLAIGGGDNVSASGVYLSNDASSGTPNRIVNNEFRAILTTPPNSIHSYANAITFEGHGSTTAFGNDIVQGNDFRSNNTLMRLSGYDGGSYQQAVRDNSLAWTGGDETYNWLKTAMADSRYNFEYDSSNRYVTSALLQEIKAEVLDEVRALITGVTDNQTRSTFFTGWSGGFNSKVTLIDVKAASQVGLTARDTVSRTSSSVDVDLRIGHSLHVVAKDAGGRLLANQTIQVRDSSGITFTGKTDANGLARLELIDYALVRSPSSSTQAVTQVNRTGHAAQISGYQAVALSLSISQNVSSPLTLTFQSLTLSSSGSVTESETTLSATAPVTESSSSLEEETVVETSTSSMYSISSESETTTVAESEAETSGIDESLFLEAVSSQDQATDTSSATVDVEAEGSLQASVDVSDEVLAEWNATEWWKV